MTHAALKAAVTAAHSEISASLAKARAGETRNPDDSEWTVMAECYQDALNALAPVMALASGAAASAR